MADIVTMMLTRAGLKLYGKVQAGLTKLEIPRVVVGDGELDGSDIYNLVALKSKVDVETPIINYEQIGDGQLRLTFRITGTKDFYLREIGVMATDPDEGEVLYCYCNYGEYAEYVMTYAGSIPVTQEADIYFAIGGTEEISVVINEDTSSVTHLELEAHTGNTNNPHKVTAAQVFPKNSETLSAISQETKTGYDAAARDAHKHDNGSVLAAIDNTKVAEWDDANAHTSKKDNPHGVTKEQVGLGNVPNVGTDDQTPTYTAAEDVSELESGEKISIAFGKIAAAIKKFISHLADKDNPHGVTKSQVGLSNVDNTSDTAKPVSTAQRTAINGVSDNLKTHISDKGNPHEVTPQKIGLGNVTNESKETMFTNPVFTGSARSTTPPASDRGTRVATTAFVQSLIDQVKEQIAEVGRNAIGAVYAQYLLGGRHYDGVSDFDDDKYLITYAERAAGTIDLGVYEVLQGAELPQPTPGKVYFGCCTDSLDAVIDDQVVCTQFLLYPNDTVYIRTAETWYYMDGVISHPSFGEWFETPYNISYFENHL